MKIKTIDIEAKEWFDKINGNSYFAGDIVINYGMKDAKELAIPFQYGYGDHYRHQAMDILEKSGLLSVKCNKNTSIYKYCDENNIILRCNKTENCKKRDLV